jgi:hypothetical protein
MRSKMASSTRPTSTMMSVEITKGPRIVKFYKTSMYKAAQDYAAQARGVGRPPPGGGLHDPASANCASMAARRLHNIADRQLRDEGHRWTR